MIDNQQSKDLRRLLPPDFEERTPIEALYVLDELLSQYPGDGRLLTRKAYVLDELSRFEEAEVAAKQALECNMKDRHAAYAWFVLGYAAARRKDYEEAVHCYTNMVDGKRDFNSLTILAAVEAVTNPLMAIEHAEEALTLNPDWEEAATILRNTRKKLHSN